MSDLEQRIEDVLVRVEGVKLTSTQFNKDMPVGTPMQALKDATTELKALYEQYATEQVGEALVLVDRLIQYEGYWDHRTSVDDVLRLMETEKQDGVNREEKE